MDQETLESKNQDESDQRPEDMNVEHNASGSDNDNFSDTSLTVENVDNGTSRSQETPGNNEQSQDSQNPEVNIDKPSEDMDKENVYVKADENKDLLDQDYQEEQYSTRKTKADTYVNAEEDQDDDEYNEKYVQDESKSSYIYLEEEFASIINPDPNKGIIEETFALTMFVLD